MYICIHILIYVYIIYIYIYIYCYIYNIYIYIYTRHSCASRCPLAPRHLRCVVSRRVISCVVVSTSGRSAAGLSDLLMLAFVSGKALQTDTETCRSSTDMVIDCRTLCASGIATCVMQIA